MFSSCVSCVSCVFHVFVPVEVLSVEASVDPEADDEHAYDHEGDGHEEVERTNTLGAGRRGRRGQLVGSSEDETAPLPQWVMSAGPAAGLGAVEPAADGVVDAAWRDLTLAQREAARVLGYTKRKWDRNKSVPADDKYWVDLSSEETCV